MTVDELLRMVKATLGISPVADCEAGDSNRDDEITIDEIVAAVANALGACGHPAPPAVAAP